MNFAAALVGLSLGQPATPPSDYYPMSSRSIKIPIKYEKDRKLIRQVKLLVAPKGENTWYQDAAVPPDRDFFTYLAKEDGVYWFTMVEEDLQGRQVPADLTRTPPDLKVIVDTVQPRVQFTSAKRNGEEVVVEWFVDDKNPDEAKTQVHFRVGGDAGYWQEVTLPANSKSGVRFPSGTTGPVAVRVTAFDIAGNKTEMVREFPGDAPAGPPPGGMSSTSLSPPAGPPVKPPAGDGPIAPPDLGPLPPAGGPTPPAGPPVPPVAPPANTGNAAASSNTNSGAAPLPAPDPKTAGSAGPTPVAVWSGAPASSPVVEVTRAQSINYLAFDLGYEVESRGPSGIGRLDLWVTRDDGKTWLKWSQHDGKASSVRVNLNVPANPQPEGTYGFRVVPVSGAGLSEREPVSGDAPDLRLVVDVTPPQLDIFPPAGDPSSPDTLVIQWKATDRHFGDDPITVEWSDKPTGPWQPAAGAAEVLQAGAGNAPQARRLPNTGSFGWRVPAGVAPRVYLKVTARDAAGNVREVVTRDPILVDLVKPRAKINGIVTPAGGPRP
jgi:hypothetical protein